MYKGPVVIRMFILETLWCAVYQYVLYTEHNFWGEQELRFMTNILRFCMVQLYWLFLLNLNHWTCHCFFRVWPVCTLYQGKALNGKTKMTMSFFLGNNFMSKEYDCFASNFCRHWNMKIVAEWDILFTSVTFCLHAIWLMHHFRHQCTVLNASFVFLNLAHSFVRPNTWLCFKHAIITKAGS